MSDVHAKVLATDAAAAVPMVAGGALTASFGQTVCEVGQVPGLKPEEFHGPP
ncbi:hypothetical protein [Streptomyces sp. 7N604]|uniref:hypothetical protein n=1 Tax=Streptomyces sp. 7N604 TaxID=3457415 RepID=UPI003FCF02DB